MLANTLIQPPGPIPLPIIGNTHLLPDRKPWIYFEELSKRLKSPVITFWIGRNPTVWINDAWSASELLEKKAATAKRIESMKREFDFISKMDAQDVNYVLNKKKEHAALLIQRNFRRQK